MKKTVVKEFRDLSVVELEKREETLKESLFNLRFRNTIKQLENPREISSVRRQIALVKTILRERELENSQEVAKA